MINGAHAILYSDHADATRATLAKVLGIRSVDAGGGWRIFALPPAELAVHPAEEGGRAELYLLCDDVAATVAALQAEGIEIVRPISDQGWGLLTAISLPAGWNSASTSHATRPRPSRPESQRSPSGKLAHACLQPWPPACSTPTLAGRPRLQSTKPQTLGYGRKARVGAVVSVWNETAAARDQRIANLAGGSGDGDRGVTHGTPPRSARDPDHQGLTLPPATTQAGRANPTTAAAQL